MPNADELGEFVKKFEDELRQFQVQYHASLVKLLNLTNHSVYHHAKDPSRTGC
jgi:hypothetical protein